LHVDQTLAISRLILCKSRPQPIGVRGGWGCWWPILRVFLFFKDFGPPWENQRGNKYLGWWLEETDASGHRGEVIEAVPKGNCFWYLEIVGPGPVRHQSYIYIYIYIHICWVNINKKYVRVHCETCFNVYMF